MKTYVGDFETTVYDGQTDTRVWASALVELNSENVRIVGSIKEQFYDFLKMDDDICVYYHNLKFDGIFWLDFLLNRGYKPALNGNKWLKDELLESGDFRCAISNMGQFYIITARMPNGHLLELRDSLKLLPFSVRQIGQSFKTKHQKLDMEYTGYRYENCPISEQEREYIANDVLVVKEALEFMFSEGHNKLTIGACCMSEYKDILEHTTAMEWTDLFPDVAKKKTPDKTMTVDEYVRKAYRGGWCYCVAGKENQIFYNGVTFDVNSLYPSMMHSMSGNRFPVGVAHFWKGNIPEEAIAKNRYFFVCFTCRFEIKEGYLPFIQIKGDARYRGTDMLTTSDYIDKEGKRHSFYYNAKMELVPSTVTLTMTCTDWYLMHEYYNVYDIKIIDGCWFYTELGLFDKYIDKYAKIKQTSKGAMRQLAKLFLNNLYGKFAASEDSSFKIPILKNGVVSFETVLAKDKRAGYIPVGAAITSYAREFTIRAAQANFHGVDKPGFIYADTDSIHCDLQPEEIKGVVSHPTKFCCWAAEGKWESAIFVRQKTYIEKLVEKDLERDPKTGEWHGEPIAKTDVKCAGMPQEAKNSFLHDMNTLLDFRVGLAVKGKLMPKRIPGGVLLVETDFVMHEKK